MDAGRRERVVLVHDWLTGTRGGEKCLEPLCRRWPDAHLYTLFHKKGSVPPAVEALRVRPSFLNRLPGVERYYRYLLPLMPLAAGWKIAGADLVVSLSHAVAKSARAPKGVPHVCYCFTPMRYAWHMKDAYFRTTTPAGRLKAHAVDALLGRIRAWDRRTADRVTHFVAISQTVRDRIRDCYARDAAVIYPPVDTEFYTPTHQKREDFYLVVSALAPYKRFDLAVDACARLGRRLVVIGSGQHAARLRAGAGPNVEFLGWQPDDVIRDYLRRARALLFPGEEDFGIVPLEAQACGCPVVGFGRGGLTETVRPLGTSSEPTGVFFVAQEIEAVCAALEQFERESDRFDPRAARRQAMLFRKERFELELFAH
ncbi:MAG: glycosyltransferase, partial [Gemmataceae bacterium]|nr:glycosyltransferase [Gemmataceae bacterium]